jgi:cyclophilin family peptidyl-prolyl cis-trans isomerase
MAGPRVHHPDRWLARLACVLAAAAPLWGCGSGESVPPAQSAQQVAFEAPVPPAGPREEAVLAIRGLGEIHVELLADKAPKTVEHFKKLAAEGFFDGTTFHRVIPDFMIQGGDPNTRDRDPRNDGKGGPGHTIQDEPSDVSHARGVVSIANRGRPNTGGSQFFIVVSDSPHLDGKYSPFGRVTAGMEIADQIASTPRDEYGRYGPPDRPLESVVVETVRIQPVAVPAVAGAPGGEVTPASGGAAPEATSEAAAGTPALGEAPAQTGPGTAGGPTDLARPKG